MSLLTENLTLWPWFSFLDTSLPPCDTCFFHWYVCTRSFWEVQHSYYDYSETWTVIGRDDFLSINQYDAFSFPDTDLPHTGFFHWYVCTRYFPAPFGKFHNPVIVKLGPHNHWTTRPMTQNQHWAVMPQSLTTESWPVVQVDTMIFFQ
jgi:hypothetical protein